MKECQRKKRKNYYILESSANDNSLENKIFNIIKNDLNNGDFLMIKGSNSTGLNKITKQIGSKS